MGSNMKSPGYVTRVRGGLGKAESVVPKWLGGLFVESLGFCWGQGGGGSGGTGGGDPN